MICIIDTSTNIGKKELHNITEELRKANAVFQAKLDEVLSTWKSQSKICNLLGIDEDSFWDIVKNRRILKEKWHGTDPFIYILMYKELKP